MDRLTEIFWKGGRFVSIFSFLPKTTMVTDALYTPCCIEGIRVATFATPDSTTHICLPRKHHIFELKHSICHTSCQFLVVEIHQHTKTIRSTSVILMSLISGRNCLRLSPLELFPTYSVPPSALMVWADGSWCVVYFVLSIPPIATELTICSA